MKIYVISLTLLFIIRLRFPSNKSIADIITTRYGRPVLHLIRKFESLDFKHRKVLLDLEFLENCIKHDLIPTFVRFKVANHRLKKSKAYKECQMKLLRQEISNKNSKLNVLNKKLSSLKSDIRNKVSWIDFAHISSCFLSRNDKVLNKARLTQEKKLFNMGMRSAHEMNNPEKVIFNFSSRVLTQSEKSLLAKGLNLSIPPKRLNYGDLLTPFELLYRDIIKSEPSFVDGENKPFEAALRNAAFDTLKTFNPKKEQNLPPEEVEALKTLLKDDSIVIQKSDKGNSVVILDRSTYIERVLDILADTSKFRKINIAEGKDYNYIHNQELRISRELKKLNKKGTLSDSEYEELAPCGSRPSILYGLPKVHKTVLNNSPKQRPILSAINTPTYKLSKYLVKLLEPFTRNKHTTKDSFSFAEEIRNQQSNLIMASLDVEGLFTNIPLEETIDICVGLLFKDKDIVDGLSKDEFRTLLALATKESLILFDGCYYQQIDGVAMGSPLGPTLANIFLCFYEQDWLSSCPSDFKPVFYKRYVDDMFLLFNSLDQVDSFKAYMNTRHTNMKFTSELEVDNVLPFLDIKVIRDGDSFITSVYRKPTFSGVYTNFESFLPDMYKTGLIRTLLFRLYTICSNWGLIHSEIQHLKNIMKCNAYPDKFIDYIIKCFLNQLYMQRNTSIPSSSYKKFQIFLPFLGSVSSKTERLISKAFRQYLPDCRVKLISSASVRLNSLFNFKDRIPKYLSSGVVYKFTCSRCNSTYIGKTKRHMRTRHCEHLGISPLTGKKLKTAQPSAILDHTSECHGAVNFDSFSTLGADANNWFLMIKESIFIQRDQPNLNVRGSSIPLKLFKN